MYKLAHHQRVILAAVKDRPPVAPKEHREAEERLRTSPEILLLREIMLWWRELGLAQYCPFTTAILNRRGDFKRTVADFCRDIKGSSFFIQQAILFLQYVSADSQALVAAVAATECALIQARERDSYEGVIVWAHDPDVVFDFLLHGTPFDETTIEGRFRFRVGRGISGGMEWSEEG